MSIGIGLFYYLKCLLLIIFLWKCFADHLDFAHWPSLLVITFEHYQGFSTCNTGSKTEPLVKPKRGWRISKNWVRRQSFIIKPTASYVLVMVSEGYIKINRKRKLIQQKTNCQMFLLSIIVNNSQVNTSNSFIYFQKMQEQLTIFDNLWITDSYKMSACSSN